MSDICSAETRGQAGSGISGCGVGGVGTRLAGYSRGGGAGSRRWMALTENRLLKQHDISWNESTHAHTHIRTNTHFFWQSLCASMHTNWHSILLLVLSRPPLFACLPPHTSGFLKAFPCPAHTRRSVSVFFFFNPCFHLKSANVDGVGGVFHLRRQLLSNSLPSLCLSSSISSGPPPPLKPNTPNEP